MIPRIIYYEWVSPHPFPEQFNKYIDGWRELMPDYDIRMINMSNIDFTPFVAESIKRRIYTCAAEYNVIKRLYETGGIHFGIDVQAVKKFDDLLSESFFIGCEAPYRLNLSVAGSEPGHWFLGECLNRLDCFDFNHPGSCGIEIESTVEMYTKIAHEHGWAKEDKTQRLEGFTVFNSKYFYPYYFNDKFTPECMTEETHAVHHWAGTWTKDCYK